MEIDPEKPKARNRKFDRPNVPRDEPTSRKRHRVRGWCRRGVELVEVGAARAERSTWPRFFNAVFTQVLRFFLFLCDAQASVALRAGDGQPAWRLRTRLPFTTDRMSKSKSKSKGKSKSMN